MKNDGGHGMMIKKEPVCVEKKHRYTKDFTHYVIRMILGIVVVEIKVIVVMDQNIVVAMDVLIMQKIQTYS